MTFYLFVPLILTLGVAFATQGSLTATRRPTLGALGAWFFGVEVVVCGLAVGLAALAVSRPREERCPIAHTEWLLALGLLFGSAVVGGLVLATAIADGRKQHGMLVWHLIAVPIAAALPYVVGFAYLYWGLSCTS